MQFKLPELGEGVHEGEMVKWLVKPGDGVAFDQPLCEIMTDKATVEIPSAFAGKVGELHAKEGEVVHVGQLLLSFEGGEGKSEAKSSAPAPGSSPKPSEPAAKQMAPAAGATSRDFARENLDPGTRPLAAPSTRRAAREMGVDLASIQGSGPDGRIMREDLSGGNAKANGAAPSKSRTVAATITPQQGDERVPFRGLRKKIAEKMRQSKDHAAHFTYVEEADATELVALRAQAKEIGAAEGIKVTYLPFVMKAMVAALRKYPILNSSLDEAAGEIVIKHHYNIALSVQTEDGLTAPVIKNVESKSVLQIAKEIQDVVERARHKKLTMDDFSGSTITLTNAGSIGGLFATPVINYPEVAILGFNKIFRRAVVKNTSKTKTPKEEIVIRDWTYFSISLDHRIVDGAVGAEFMKLFIQYIENPSLLVLT